MMAAPLGFKRAENGHKSVFGRTRPHTLHHTLALELVVTRRDAMVQSRVRGRVGGCTLARV